MDLNNFYRAFEDRHRGPREVILQRLQVYRPFVAPLLQIYQDSPAIDLGCGRGEWLEFAKSLGFLAYGVDLDERMLMACQERGLYGSQGDAVDYLRAQTDNSLSIVSGFHLAEHISFDQLRTLVAEALRALRPGGLLILETPNPENLVVGSSSFYLDPTHERPIPPLLLSFLVEYAGFGRVKILRLQEYPDLLDREEVGLIEVLSGVSPDYSVVAQKKASEEITNRFDSVFSGSFGIELQELASRYDKKWNLMQDQNEVLKADFQSMRDEFRASQGAHARELEALRVSWDEKHRKLHQLCMRSDWQHANYEKNIYEIKKSWSWRITAPLRWVGAFFQEKFWGLRSFVNKIIFRCINSNAGILLGLMNIALRYPRVGYSINQFLLRWLPHVHEQLRSVAKLPAEIIRPSKRKQKISGLGAADDLESKLTPHGRRALADLRAAIIDRKEHS